MNVAILHHGNQHTLTGLKFDRSPVVRSAPVCDTLPKGYLVKLVAQSLISGP